MKETWGFLAALDLDEMADARAIRRAYARKLKTIDQGADAAGFQALREAYETALDWAAYEVQERQEAETVVAAPAPDDVPAVSLEKEQPEPAPSEETQLANAVWERFIDGRQELLQTGRLGDPDAWHEVLCARLQDEELIHIGARMQFEWRIVHILGNGWQAGHEALFPAAVAAFDWARDRRRLAQFGYFGDLLNAAIDERALFDSQAIAVRSVQERIAMLLRREQPADPREIVQSMAELRKMQERFPSLLQVVTNAESVDYWHAQHPASEIDEEQRIGKRNRHWDGLLVFIVLALASYFAYNGTNPTPASEHLRAGTDIIERQEVDPLANPPTQAQLEQHMPPLRFQPGSDAPPGNYIVEFEVSLDAEGKVIGINKLQDSQLPGFDEAIEAALWAATSFPPQTARIFRVSMYANIAPKAPGPRRPRATTQV